MISGLTARLAELAALNQTVTYGKLARDLGLTGPATIARLTADLETLMEEDAALNHPFRATGSLRPPRARPARHRLLRQGHRPWPLSGARPRPIYRG